MKQMKVTRGTARAKRRTAMNYDPQPCAVQPISTSRFYRLLGMGALHKL